MTQNPIVTFTMENGDMIEADLAEDETVGNLKESLFRTLKMLGIEMVVFQTYAEMIESNLIQPYYLP